MAEVKERITSHMNRVHQLALSDYLVAYGKIDLSKLDGESIGISDVDDSSMTISYKTVDGTEKAFQIYWDDAIEDEKLVVKSYGDIKPKLVAMAKYASKVQGFSHVQITTATPPTDLSKPMYVIFLIFAMEVVKEGSVRSAVHNVKLLSYLASLSPSATSSFLDFFEEYATLLFTLIYSIHLAEVLYFTVPNLRRYRVPVKQSLIWIIMHFVEGFFVIQRFNKLKE